MAQKAKKEYEDAIKKEQQQLAGVFEKNYVTYNVQLYVEGANLKNQNGDNIQLKGFGTTYWYLTEEDFSKFAGVSGKTYKDYYNKESFGTIKKWGANCVRITITRELYMQSENNMSKVYDIIDDLTANDMYVVVNWHCFNNPNTNVTDNIEFFTKIAEKYKDTPNIIYEIYNEPCGNDVTWEVIKEYIEKIVPEIRKIDDDSIIIVPTPNYDKNITDVIGNTVNFKNILYSYHFYAGDVNAQQEIDKIRECILNNIPLFATEWGETKNDGMTGFYEESSNFIVKMMDENQISWANWCFCDTHYGKESIGATVKANSWRNDLGDDILTEGGKYIKELLLGIRESYNSLENLNMVASQDNYKYGYMLSNKKENIVEVKFEDRIEKPENIVEEWDLSYIYNTKRVVGYLVKTENELEYKLIIQANGRISTPYSARGLFSGLVNLKQINFEVLDTSKSSNLLYTFAGCENLETINLSGMDFTSITNLQSTFTKCTKLKNINFGEVDMSNVKKFLGMFSQCNNLTNIDFSKVKSKNAVDMSSMFRFSTINGDLDLRNFNTENLTNTSYMFGNTVITGNLFLPDISKVSNTTGMFEYGNVYQNIYCVNEENATKVNTLTSNKYLSKIYYKNEQGEYVKYES